MNTFLPYGDPVRTARVLDRQRLGKQRVECIQILGTLTDPAPGRGWARHPAVLMWRGYEPFLLRSYLRAMMDEWMARGYRNDLSEVHFARLEGVIGGCRSRVPPWFGDALFRSHRSNLLRKDPRHYRRYWPALRDDLPYLWPVLS